LDYTRNACGRVWLIGGTRESGELAIALARAELPCTVTVTTEAARSLYPSAPTLRVIVGRLDADKLAEFLQQQQIVAVLDASHPYAVEISRMAIASATEGQIPYLRYERPSVDSQMGSRSLMLLDSFDTLLAGDYLYQQRVLLTVGYRPLSLFRLWQDRSSLFARILPSATAIDAALAAGFKPERLIALRPPIPPDLEKALWQHWKISLVVTKASGVAGGEDVKRALAAELGIPLIIIARPNVSYPQQTSELSATLEFCRCYLFSGLVPEI